MESTFGFLSILDLLEDIRRKHILLFIGGGGGSLSCFLFFLDFYFVSLGDFLEDFFFFIKIESCQIYKRKGGVRYGMMKDVRRENGEGN